MKVLLSDLNMGGVRDVGIIEEVLTVDKTYGLFKKRIVKETEYTVLRSDGKTIDYPEWAVNELDVAKLKKIKELKELRNAI